MTLTRSFAAMGAALLFTAAASAQFASLQIENATNLFTGGNHFGANQANVESAWDTFTQSGNNPHTVYRLYAEFTSPTSFVESIGIFPGSPPLEINVTHPSPTGPVVYNDADNGVLAPTEAALADPSTARRAFDTFATIGVDVDTGLNQTSWGGFQGNLYGLFDVNADAGLYSADQDTWFVPAATPAHAFATPGGSAGYRVLIAQFTVADGTQISGTLSGSYGVDSFMLGDDLFTFTASFTTVPAPGALALLAIACLTSRRRRAS